MSAVQAKPKMPSARPARVACGRCNGAGTILDTDPYADRRQNICCPACAGAKTVDAAAPRLIDLKFFGYDSIHKRHVAALVPAPMSRPDLDQHVYCKLVPGARLQIRLARKWGLWGVMATDDWATLFGAYPNPPPASAS